MVASPPHTARFIPSNQRVFGRRLFTFDFGDRKLPGHNRFHEKSSGPLTFTVYTRNMVELATTTEEQQRCFKENVNEKDTYVL